MSHLCRLVETITDILYDKERDFIEIYTRDEVLT